MKKLNKIIDDTLKSPNGKWSRKSLTMCISFIVSIILGGFVVASTSIKGTDIDSDVIVIILGFLTMSTGQSILALKDKIDNRNSTEE